MPRPNAAEPDRRRSVRRGRQLPALTLDGHVNHVRTRAALERVLKLSALDVAMRLSRPRVVTGTTERSRMSRCRVALAASSRGLYARTRRPLELRLALCPVHDGPDVLAARGADARARQRETRPVRTDGDRPRTVVLVLRAVVL